MAVAAQAALLDELMGKGRNVSLSEAKAPHWSDDDMCKYFLAGLCPHDLFNNTKDDLGPCEKVHDDSILASYNKSKRCGEMRYEERLCAYLRDLISTVESRIRRGETRLQKNGNLVHSFYNCEREEVLEELTVKIEDTLSKVEKLGTDGEVEQSRVWLDVAEKLKNEKSRLERNIEIYNQQAKELEICKTCGAFQVKGDAHQRIEEHLQGKMHLGYAHIREYLASHIVDKDKINKEDKRKKSESHDKEKSKKDDNNKEWNKDSEHAKEVKKERVTSNEKHREQVKEKGKDYEDSNKWNKEQCKGKERNNDGHKEEYKVRERNNEGHKEEYKVRERNNEGHKGDYKVRERNNEGHKEEYKVRERNNDGHKEEYKVRERNNDGHKEEYKVKERHKDNTKERKRKRSTSKQKHHSDNKHSRRTNDHDTLRHSKNKRRSKSSKRHVHS